MISAKKRQDLPSHISKLLESKKTVDVELWLEYAMDLMLDDNYPGAAVLIATYNL